MMCFTSRKTFTLALFVTSVFAFGMVVNQSHATIVGAQSFGDELAGARIVVTFAQQGAQATNIVAGGPGVGLATLPSLFDFSVSGDTFLSDWRLTNTTTFDTIESVLFDLSGTTSPGSLAFPGPHSPGVLFDDGSLPSTANGFAGRAGAIQVNPGSPVILNSFEDTLWADAMNAGDEWIRETIEYEDFGPGLTSVWRDDTDIVGVDTGPEVPEPATALLVLSGLVCGVLQRRRSH